MEIDREASKYKKVEFLYVVFLLAFCPILRG